MNYFAGKELFWEKEHHFLFGDGGVRAQVKARESTILPNTTFPPEFARQLDELRESIAADLKVQAVIETLKQNNLLLVANQTGLGQPSPRRKPYPWWYYGRKVWALYKCYFPDGFDPALRKGTETIPQDSLR